MEVPVEIKVEVAVVLVVSVLATAFQASVENARVATGVAVEGLDRQRAVAEVDGLELAAVGVVGEDEDEVRGVGFARGFRAAGEGARARVRGVRGEERQRGDRDRARGVPAG